MAAAFVIGSDAGFVASANLFEVDAAAEVIGERVEEFADVDAFFGKIEEGEDFAAQDGFGVDDFEIAVDALRDSAGVHLEGVTGLLERGLGVHVFARGDAEGAAFGKEWVVAATGVADVPEHVFAGDALAATGVAAGAGEHLADFGAAMGADDDLAAASGFDVAGVRVFADHLHDAEANDECFGLFQGFVSGAVLLIEHGFDVGFELGEWEDGHSWGSSSLRRGKKGLICCRKSGRGRRQRPAGC